jgi:hypothetical protein
VIITGYLRDGRAYAADVAASRHHPLYGAVEGPSFLLALLAAYAGREVAVTPTGPFVTVDLNDSSSVLAALYSLTQVTDVRAAADGPVPQVLPPSDPGATY